MISWLQKNFQQHYRIVFGILLALIIVSFVFITNASSGLGNADAKTLKTPFFDLNLGAREDMLKVVRDASLAVELKFGFNPGGNPEFQDFALSRYASLHLANQLHIPAPSKSELEEYIKTLRKFAGENGQFEQKKYDDFRKTLAGQDLNEAQIVRILSDSIRIDRVLKFIGGPGYVLSADVKRELSLADTSWTLQTASIDRSSFTPAITPTEADLTKYFEENGPRYTLPAQVSINYLDFDADRYVALVPPVSETELRAFYDSNPARFPIADRKPGDAANPDVDFIKVRSQVDATLRRNQATELARKAASDAAFALFDQKLTPASPAFTTLLATYNVTLKEAPAFGPENIPPALGRNPAIATEAFKLSQERLTSDAVATEKGAVILFWKASIPSRQPTFLEVREKVAADYKEGELAKRFTQLGQTIRGQIQARMKAGDTFEKAAANAAESSGVKIQTQAVPAFTLRQPPPNFSGELYELLQNLNAGEVSPMTLDGDKGLIAYAQEKKLPDLSDANPQYATLRTRIAESHSAASGQSYLRELVQQELAKSEATRQ